ncbi:hypothetical protein Taro_054986 [Colocasia esculenta]|uniref:Uncharacterized protein n=1 Tax=Colocasia esculenta TaxID=4460 RepID=A0A843XPV6_COLES|nr:hypothetical protein [Colocasia esculenta]
MKRNYSAFAEDIPAYSDPKAARETHADLKQLSAIPGHIYARPDLQISGLFFLRFCTFCIALLFLLCFALFRSVLLRFILPGQRRFSKMPWLVPMLELLPPASISHLKEWELSTIFVLAKNYNKLVHVWESVTAMVELWHPQTNSFIFPEFEATIFLEELEIMLGLPRYQRGEDFRGLHDTTDWRERAREQIENWEQKVKGVRSDVTTDDAYLQAYALKYRGKVDVSGEIASLRALLQSAVQDREAAQRQTTELRSELERVRGTGAGGASSSRSAGGSPSLMEARLARAVLRAEEAQRHLEERERDLELALKQAMTLQSERDQLRVRAEAAESQVAEMTQELATLRIQRPSRDQEEVIRLRAELLAQQTLARSLQQIVTDMGHSRSRSRSGVSVSRATGASIGQYLAGSSSRRRNEEEERHRLGDDGRGGGEMLPPPDRREGSGESGGGQ